MSGEVGAPRTAPRLGVSDLADVERIEAFTLEAVPARDNWELPGWWCVADDGGYVGRANSATSIPCPPGVEPARLSQVAASYRERGLSAKVRWTPVAPASVADDVADGLWLATGGVEVMVGATATLTARTAARAAGIPAGHTALLLAAPDDDWANLYLQANADGSGAARLRLAAEAPQTKVYLRVAVAQETAAIGLGVVMGSLLGIFDVVTAPQFRRMGYGRLLMHELLTWGEARGATTAFLQVHGANEPAKALYRALGFDIGYTYYYLTPHQP